ncbi:hypothetical protein BKA70DRAFT_1234824 [Coprinopsis sp. MPI-PUGE-AT-0042]|nr:hypothetical protein BKA70DRAFT_1234824 [Coprinopsis sp. MPI-PUGE-AT-0042]
MPMVLFLGMYVVHQRWSQGAAESDVTVLALQRPKPERSSWRQLGHSLMRIPTRFGLFFAMLKRWNAFPAFLGLGVVLVINVVFVIDIELALHGNQALQDQDEAAWGFCQTLAILLLLLPLRDLIEALLERRFKQRHFESDVGLGSDPKPTGYFEFWNLVYKHRAICELNELRFNRMTFAERELDARIFAAVQRRDFSALAFAYSQGADLATGVFHSVGWYTLACWCARVLTMFREAAGWILDQAVLSANSPIRDNCSKLTGTHVNWIGNTGQTILTAASRNGDEALVKLLLANPGIDTNLIDSSVHAATPLIASLEGGHLDITKRSNPYAYTANSRVRTPLMNAAVLGRETFVMYSGSEVSGPISDFELTRTRSLGG